jgi:hypothetical protein
LLRDNDPVIVETSVPAPIPSVKDAEGDEDDKKKDDEDDDKAADDDADEANAAESEGDAAEEGNAADGKKAKTKSRKKSSSSGSKSKPSSSLPDPKPTPTPTPAAKEDDLSVDCILDPSKCGKGPKKSAQPAAPPTDPNLPDTLKTADIKSGVAPYTGAAKACGSKHGAKPGTKVKVKLSISGASGSVSSAAANAPHTGTPLGNCVAAALKKSKFSKFKKSSLGVVYPVTM